MKRKFLTTAVTAILAATTLGACGTNYKVTFMDFWKKSVADNVIHTVTEVSEYDFSFQNGTNNSYSVAYQNGSYKTTFVSETKDQKIIYHYTTEFSIQVQYTVGGETSEWLQDSVVSTVSFQSSNFALKPIRSEKHAINHSPMSISPSSLQTAFTKFDKTIITEYDKDCENGTTTITDNMLTADNVTTETFEISHGTYNYLDNEQLAFVLRCIDTGATTSTKFKIFDPFDNDTHKINVNFNKETTAEFNFAIGGETATRSLAYYPVSVQLSARINKGLPKTYWIAKTTDWQNNVYRNVLLRHEIPLYYNLGTLVFELKSVSFAQ